MTSRYYRPSGQFGVGGALAAVGIGCVGAVILGLLYGYLTLYNPLLVLNFVGTIGLGFAAGLAATFGITLFKLRAPGVAASLGALIGAVAVYASWVAWCHGFAARSGEASWILDPAGLAAQLAVIAERGAWSLRTWTPTGGLLVALWGLEALAIVAVPTIIAWSAGGEPFCEGCQQWVRPEVSWPLGVIDKRQPLIDRLVAGEIEALAELTAGDAGKLSEATIKSCPECRQTAFLSLAEVKLRRRGTKRKAERNELLSRLILDPPGLATARRLARSAVNPAETADPEAPAVEPD